MAKMPSEQRTSASPFFSFSDNDNYYAIPENITELVNTENLYTGPEIPISLDELKEFRKLVPTDADNDGAEERCLLAERAVSRQNFFKERKRKAQLSESFEREFLWPHPFKQSKALKCANVKDAIVDKCESEEEEQAVAFSCNHRLIKFLAEEQHFWEAEIGESLDLIESLQEYFVRIPPSLAPRPFDWQSVLRWARLQCNLSGDERMEEAWARASQRLARIFNKEHSSES